MNISRAEGIDFDTFLLMGEVVHDMHHLWYFNYWEKQTGRIKNSRGAIFVSLAKDYAEKNNMKISDGDSFCKEVVGYLVKSKWKRNVILEYLFEFHNQLLSDLESLKMLR